MPRTVLVIAPHGLDEALGCGGAMARHADAGDTVHILILFGDGTARDAPRRAAAAKAARILGAHPPQFAGFPENRSDTIPLAEIITAIEKCAAELKPEVAYVRRPAPHGRYCGVASFYRPRANPANYMINARCLEGVDLDSLERVRFDGVSWEARLDAPYKGIWKV